jgi:23S rRNA pseudouridine1911/1915/1917 synthase
MDTITLPIIFEDESLLVLNKPAGVTVNVAETTVPGETVQDWMEEYLQIKQPASQVNAEDLSDDERDEVAFYQRAGIAHRIDKETSGILLVAKKPEIFISLLRQFRERTVKKTYVALAHGKVLPTEGEINVPVGRLPWNRRSFGVVAGGREAKTIYHVKNFYKMDGKKGGDVLSYLELSPETGRTHQIRVHLKYINHPIFADFLYAGRKIQRNDRKILSRVFLHAFSIAFVHPATNKKILFNAPLPAELQDVLDSLEPLEM